MSGWRQVWLSGTVAAFVAAGVGAALAVASSVAAGPTGDPADLVLTKSDSPDPVSEDAALTYALEIRNGGPDPATNVRVSDDLPSQVDPGSANASTGTCDIQGKRVNCDLGTLASGGSATVTIQVTAKKAGQLTNTAAVESDVDDQQTANNQDTETTTVTEPAAGGRCAKRTATRTGTEAGETLTGTEKKDVILALGGDDQVNAGAGGDSICAGSGNDSVLAGSGNDLAKGQDGGDALKGQGGGDTLRGNRGRDRLRGGGGNDVLVGGKGRDSCKGGRGRDTLRSC
jgi:uncharacterized repeat protein (TIGR01451 family)